MNRVLWLAPAAAALAAAAVGTWWLLQPVPIPAAPAAPAAQIRLARATGAEISMLEAKAGRACRCARRLPTASPGRTACWADFERNIARYEHEEMSSMCIPLSTTVDCFPAMNGQCFVKDEGGGACSLDEARTLEAIWAQGARGDQQSQDRASRQMDEAVRAFIRHERVPVPRPSGESCSD